MRSVREFNFVKRLERELCLKKTEDWYRVSKDVIREKGGEEFLKHNHGKPIELLRRVYPTHRWYLFRFEENVPAGYWNDRENVIDFVECMGIHFGCKKMSDWYQLKTRDVIEFGGSRVLQKFNGIQNLLQSVYPDHDWVDNLWRSGKQFGSLRLSSDRKEFVNHVTSELFLHSLDDWYRVSKKEMQEFTSVAQMNKYSLDFILTEVFPEHSWDVQKLKFKNNHSFVKSAQGRLYRIVRFLFPQSGDLLHSVLRL
eukprot:TRINITY_DN7413_c0_g1_i1.p1 TRINITY_DN7413_c0_g1~~TRINITY_DN7413_c0_g1_i1.p1  ORF type:complete len:254 (+),score=43.11 TRINITY_DN7413_c0_g1_i1:78-839(+)